jgi:hypothetical protein
MVLHTKFGDDFNAQEVFSSEQAVRMKFGLFRAHCYRILQMRNLPLAHIALTSYLAMIPEGKNEIRKDQMSRREQHEESHIDVMDKLLKATDELWIDEEKYGSVDALFVAVICHDIVEDFGVSPKMIKSIIQSGVDSLKRNSTQLNHRTDSQVEHDLNQAMVMVELLSRKDEMGMPVVGDNRIDQAKRWLEHPYVMPIKLIDWCNKLQTMPGVDHFEKDGFKRLVKVLDETALLFVDEQQDFIGQAVEKYPDINDPCRTMEGFLSSLFQMLRTYKLVQEGSIPFNPETAKPFNFDVSLDATSRILPLMLAGNNYYSPFIERLELAANDNPKVADMIKYMIAPAFDKTDPRTFPALQNN